MFVYKIVLNDDFRFVGNTLQSIIRKRFGHRVCAKNIYTSCSLYKKIRELDIEPNSIELEILEELDESDDLDTRLAYWKKIENANLDECRAHFYIDGRMIIRKSNMGCRCIIEKTNIVKGKPYLMTFD